MLITLGPERSDDKDRRLASVLAAVAGAVNAVAFQALGFFSANMTGNITSISDHVALGEWWLGAVYLTIVATFIGGAALSVIFINAGVRRELRGVYAFGILAEAILMLCLACVEVWIPSHQSGPIVVLGLSFLMGLQNAVVTRISDARVRTTHVSGMATDIGIELAVLFDAARGHEATAGESRTWPKLRLHSQTVVSFMIGGVLGVLLYQSAKHSLLFIAAGILLLLALQGLRQARSTVPRIGAAA